MNQSLYFLTAAWMAAQGGEAPRPVPSAVYAQQQAAQPTAVQVQVQVDPQPQSFRWGGERRGLLQKIGAKINSLFGRDRVQQPARDEQAQPMPMPSAQQHPYPLHREPPAAIPGRAQLGADGSPVEQAAHNAERPDAKLNKKFVEKIGHEDDYSWVTGQLIRVHAGSGPVWVVRYATVDTEDKFGGSIVLAPTVTMRNYREGDLVSVRGEILDQGRAVRHLGGALYRVTSIDMIERAD